jgi:hypothetical protein
MVNPSGPVFNTLSMELSASTLLAGSVESTLERGGDVKGAPFSADGVLEHSQLLVDGNRIVTTTTTRIYRDSEGRTRIERSTTVARVPEGTQEQKRVTISDPVSKEVYHLMPLTRTVFKTPRFELNALRIGRADAAGLIADRTANGNPEGAAAQESDRPVSASASQPKQPALRVPVPARWVGHNVDHKQESLGRQVIEGVEAEGVRVVQTLPAGAIGNQLPLETVYERWYSPELQLVILTKQTDPRLGETVYRLTNIERGEQDAALFQIPPDYTVQERSRMMLPVHGAPEPGKKNDQ